MESLSEGNVSSGSQHLLYAFNQRNTAIISEDKTVLTTKNIFKFLNFDPINHASGRVLK